MKNVLFLLTIIYSYFAHAQTFECFNDRGVQKKKGTIIINETEASVFQWGEVKTKENLAVDYRGNKILIDFFRQGDFKKPLIVLKKRKSASWFNDYKYQFVGGWKNPDAHCILLPKKVQPNEYIGGYYFREDPKMKVVLFMQDDELYSKLYDWDNIPGDSHLGKVKIGFDGTLELHYDGKRRIYLNPLKDGMEYSFYDKSGFDGILENGRAILKEKYLEF